MTGPQAILLSVLAFAYMGLFVAGYLRSPSLAEKEAFTMNWLHFAEKLLPVVFALVPGLPPGLGNSIASTMIAVESLPDKTGAQKKAIVLDQATTQLQNANVIAGHQIVNVDAVIHAVDKGIDAGVAAVNAVQKSQQPAVLPGPNFNTPV